VRNEILRALTAIGPAAIPELILALDDGRAEVRRHAARALIVAPDERAAAALCRLLSDSDPTVRWDAVCALRRLRSPDSVGTLCAALADPHPGFRREAAAALGALADPRAAPSLLLAAADEDPSVSREAARALAAMRDEGAAARLAGLAWSPAPEVAREAMTALCQREDRAVLPIAIARLAERGSGQGGDVIRWYATDALGRIGGDDATAALSDTVARDPCAMVRSGALTALWKIRDHAARCAVVGALDDPEPAVRRWAAHLLVDFGAVSAEPRVLAALRDADAEVRACACVALGGATDPTVRAALARVARRDPSRRVQRRARAALKRA
jgi:HEAT repeat protein